ncbi:glycosyltransferase [Paenibacillus qinlingensis]|uniref:Glycosyltransferase involved in cell wall biosynthesis n=1 Tax=Paenibacillus qinlingensis TaxID=1837343 RepID=A0ABU1P1G6_9BACL|nr:glycosyltransferase [Paenibacillus qinlingensis]MDR6553586.1 glycosyltransferase involved in cell wall biosynthesis [Paenibacillus qinlingensis]
MYKITAVIPAYNAAFYIEAALKSIIKQTYHVHEIIVIDDCSQDDTSKIVKELASQYHHIQFFRLNENKGVSHARNFGLKQATNNWVLLLDADDILEPNIVEKHMYYLNNIGNYSQLALIYSAYRQMDAAGEIIDGIIRGKELKQKEAFGELLVRNLIITPSGLLLNQRFVLEYGNFNESLSSQNEDWDLWLRLSRYSDIGYIDEPLVRIRRHASNATSTLNIASSLERIVLGQYQLDEIRSAVLQRSYSEVRNILDYVSMLFRFQKWDEGFVELEYLISADISEQGSILFLKAVFYINNKQFESSKSLFEQILQIIPSHGATLNNLAVLCAIESSFDEAHKFIDNALKLYPNYIDAKANLHLINANVQDLSSYRFTSRELRPVLLSYEG